MLFRDTNVREGDFGVYNEMNCARNIQLSSSSTAMGLVCWESAPSYRRR